MGKLFADEDLEIEVKSPEKLIEAKIENSDIPDIVEFHEGAIQAAVEGFSKATNDLYILQDVKASLESKKISSIEYFTSIENYSFYMKSVANNLGIKAKIPSMEDFKNPYGTKTSHEIVMEGFSEFIRNIWEKIKAFFKDFFKRIMLFFKRLVNANLQMEEYEMYIEDLMHNVKRSDKSRVTPIKVDSKLPELLATPDISYMRTDYLLTKGKQKMDNLTNFTNMLFDKVEREMIKDFQSNIDGLKDGIDSGLIEPGVIDNIKNSFINMFEGIFTTSVNFHSVPDDVQSDIMNMFTLSELKDGNIFSLIPDSDIYAALPKNFNIYYVSADVQIDDNTKTTKLFICSNTERNYISENKLETISSRENLLRLYDFYKKFSKEINFNKFDRMIRDFDKRIDSSFNIIKKTLSAAMENSDNKGNGTIPVNMINNVTPDKTNNFKGFKDSLYGGHVQQSQEQPTFNEIGQSQEPPMSDEIGQSQETSLSDKINAYIASKSAINNGNEHVFDNEIRNKLNDLNKFLTNVLNVIQVLLKDMNIGLLGTYQEVRYEMIKYLYKCAKQF